MNGWAEIRPHWIYPKLFPVMVNTVKVRLIQILAHAVLPFTINEKAIILPVMPKAVENVGRTGQWRYSHLLGCR